MSYIVDAKTRNAIHSAVAKLKASDISKAIGKHAGKYTNCGEHYAAYQSGKDIVGILAMFVGLGEIKAAVKSGRFLESLASSAAKNIGGAGRSLIGIFTLVKNTGVKVVYQGKKILIYSSQKGERLLFRIENEIIYLAHQLDQHLAGGKLLGTFDEVALVTPNGRRINTKVNLYEQNGRVYMQGASKGGKALDWAGLLSNDALNTIKNWGDDLKATLHADLKASNDLVEALKDVRLVEGWKKMHELGFESAVKSNPGFMDKVEFFISKGLADNQIKKIVRTKDIEALEIAEHCLKRSPPYDDVINVHNLVANANNLKQYDLHILSKVKTLVSSKYFININDLKTVLSSGKFKKGTFTEINEAVRLVKQGKKTELGTITKEGFELDVINRTDNWLVECKNVQGDGKYTLRNNIRNIGDKFNKETKLSGTLRQSFEQQGGLKGIIDITNTNNPYYHYNKGALSKEVKAIINEVAVPNDTKIGMSRIKELRVINGSGNFVFVKGIDF